jgi:hypothetical protein
MSDLICSSCFAEITEKNPVASNGCLACNDTLDPCVWCDSDTMDWNASPNGKDICNDCEDKALEESEEN